MIRIVLYGVICNRQQTYGLPVFDSVKYQIFNKMKCLIIAIILVLAKTAPPEDRVVAVPGFMGLNTDIYAGYLDVKNSNRSIYYVFVQSAKGARNQDPVTLWLNGGPGCSSLIGFLEQIGPFYVGDDYRLGDRLTQNKYSWHLKSNLLFLESPAGVGYSQNLDKNYIHNDAKTANDNLNALLDFFTKYPEYKKNDFLIAGESYAGKYIPDLAVLIDFNNEYTENQKINLKTIFIGNGVMTFETLANSTYEFMIDRSFVDPQIVPIYEIQCQKEQNASACRYFENQFAKNIIDINPYNVYGYCYYNNTDQSNLQEQKRSYSSQESILQEIKRKMQTDRSNNKITIDDYNGLPCSYSDGISNYFNANWLSFHAKSAFWNGPCASNLIYNIDPQGSVNSYRYLIDLMPYPERRIQIVLYNGNWDSVVPFTDTIKVMKLLGLQQSYLHLPWFTDQQHSGFSQIFQPIVFFTVKGASHQIPQSKPAEAFNIFSQIIQALQTGSTFENGVVGENKQTKMIQI